jgi:hypothetical protein
MSWSPPSHRSLASTVSERPPPETGLRPSTHRRNSQPEMDKAGAGVARILSSSVLLVVGCLPGRGSPDYGISIWIIWFDLASPWLQRSEKGSAPSTTSPLNKSQTACCAPASTALDLCRLPLAVRGGEGKGMMEVVVGRSGGGGSTSALVCVHGTERTLALSSFSTPPPAGRGGEGRRWLMNRRVAYFPINKRSFWCAAAPQARRVLLSGRGGEGEEATCLRSAASRAWPRRPCMGLRELPKF